MPDPLAPIALGPEAPRLLVATGRVVRGLDLSRLPYGSQPVDPKYGCGKPIDRVILFDFPSDAKAYLSRIGCATRGTAPPAPVTALVVGPQLAFARALLTHDEKGAPHALDKPGA
jgi:superfamily II DNA/RNA helicase